MTAIKPLVLGLLLACGGLAAQTADPLRAAAQRAIQTNPDVTAAFNAFRAAGHETDAARGAWYPRVDLDADVGRSRSQLSSVIESDDYLTRRGIGLSVAQLLWDGWATRSEVERLDHTRQLRYFEFVDATEQTALEAARAWYDVLRFRRLVRLAEDNYVQHKLSFEQIGSRFKAGVGRGVDVEQSAARLALAESNLSTEVANLHDVIARFQRIVGEAPPAEGRLGAGLQEGLPGDADAVLVQATLRNATVSAAVENLRAVRAQAEGQQSAYQPRVEARARSTDGQNLSGIRDRQRDTAAEVVLSWNLYNGGSDQARTRQLADLVTQAADQRDRACRDVRQTTAIAFNDTVKLREQLRNLERNAAAIERARDAYQQQFEIGQRSLLDLLNAQNEVYTARRALADAEHDLRIAYARTHASLNTLSAALGLARIDTGTSIGEDWRLAADGATRCPAMAVLPQATPLSELDARARSMMGQQPAAAPR